MGVFIQALNCGLCRWGNLNKVLIRIELEGKLAQIFKFIREAHKLKTDNELIQTLISKDIRCLGNKIEIPISKKTYQQIWRLIKEFDLDYSSVEEFVQEAFIEIMKLRFKMFDEVNMEIPQEKALAYIM